MVRVSCLARVSTMKQHLSIDNHKELFDNWIKRNKEYKMGNYIEKIINGYNGVRRKQ